jgi:hypothetical protein
MKVAFFKTRVRKSEHNERLQVVSGEILEEDRTHITVNNWRRAMQEGTDFAPRKFRKDNLIGRIRRRVMS